jgi:hypothetical protein
MGLMTRARAQKYHDHMRDWFLMLALTKLKCTPAAKLIALQLMPE